MDLERYNEVADENEVNEQPRSETTINAKALRTMKNPEASFDPEAFEMVTEAQSGNELLPIPESSAIALSVCMELIEPRIFQEAWNHTDLKQYMKQREAN